MKQLSILLFLCASLLIPQTATAQEFSFLAKQKVVVAPIRDKNDRKVSDQGKLVIRRGIVDACVNSNEYEVYEINIDDIRRQLSASGRPVNFANICKSIGDKADYIIFTEIKLSSSAIGAQDVSVFITSSLYRIATASEVRTHYVASRLNSQSILSKTSDLVSVLLGLDTNSSGQQSQGSYAQSSSYSRAQSSYAKTYRVGDYYNENGKRGVVFVVTSDGQHGKIISLTDLGEMPWSSAVQACNNLGNGWRMPTKGELVTICGVKSSLNQTLEAMGDKIIEKYHWSSNEVDSYRSWGVYMYGGGTDINYKSYHYPVRAVSAF